MNSSADFSKRFLCTLGTLLLLASFAQAGTEKVLHAFQLSEGQIPYGGVVFDRAGNLYGTTFYGKACGSNSCGVVYQLTPGTGGDWTERAIYTFTGGTDGSHPYSNLVIDALGNLYGTTYGKDQGGSGSGTAFRLSPKDDGSWQFALLHTFAGGKDGAKPSGLLAMDDAGNLYGSTFEGGSNNAGVAFELSPASGMWKETVLHTFTGGLDGSEPGGLILGPDGNLYGTTATGGTGFGVVFELSLAKNGTWHETVVHSLAGGEDGATPGSLAFDASGNLYAASASGGTSPYCSGGCGLVFKLSKESNGTWKDTPLHSFNGQNGEEPWALVFDKFGNLYGAAYGGGVGLGLIFKLDPAASWAETVVYEFTGALGGEPVQPMIFDAAGNLYGSAVYGGAGDGGVVFEITP